jgi:hypothetical protein
MYFVFSISDVVLALEFGKREWLGENLEADTQSMIYWLVSRCRQLEINTKRNTKGITNFR